MLTVTLRSAVLAFILCITTFTLYYFSFIPIFYSSIAYPFLKISHLVSHSPDDLAAQFDLDRLKSLQKENQLLALQNVRLRAALDFAKDIKELHQFNERYKQKGQIAQVLTRSFCNQEHYFLLDAGTNKKISKDMIVTFKNSLIGRITDVYPWYSKAQLITDKDCKIAAYTQHTRSLGIHGGNNSAAHCSLDFVEHLAPLKIGEKVYSSGQGLIFPRGFALGKIEAIEHNDLYKKVTVKPLCNFEKIEYCTIILKQ